MRRIQKELVKHGATLEQAKYYVRRIKECEKLSGGSGHAHHILPSGCGWWKRYSNAKWNLVLVSIELHISLHADLCHVFPDNQSLKRALKITTSLLRPSKLAFLKRNKKEEIIRRYSGGSSAKKISNGLGVNDTTITRWLKEWGVPVRTYGDAAASEKTVLAKKNKEYIISCYAAGRSSLSISRNIGVNYQTILNWLRKWDVEIRKRGWNGNDKSVRRSRSTAEKSV